MRSVADVCDLCVEDEEAGPDPANAHGDAQGGQGAAGPAPPSAGDSDASDGGGGGGAGAQEFDDDDYARAEVVQVLEPDGVTWRTATTFTHKARVPHLNALAATSLGGPCATARRPRACVCARARACGREAPARVPTRWPAARIRSAARRPVNRVWLCSVCRAVGWRGARAHFADVCQRAHLNATRDPPRA